jgi:hypothetical protein
VGELPAGHWAKVAAGLELQPGQEAQIAAAVDLFESDMRRLMAERRDVQSELAAVMGPEGDCDGVDAIGGGALSAAEREELLAVLQSNMVGRRARGDRRGTVERDDGAGRGSCRRTAARVRSGKLLGLVQATACRAAKCCADC